jgi:hypothetical protein
MPRSLILALLLGGSTPFQELGQQHGQDPDQEAGAGDTAGFVEVVSERAVLYVGEIASIRARFGFPAGFEASLVPLFRQDLELSIELELPTANPLACLEPLPALPEPLGPRLVVDGEVARARALGGVVRAGRPFEAFEVERPYRAIAAGRVELAGARLRWASAVEFREDLLAGRVPLDRDEHVASAPPLVLEIRALPEEGRPSGFTGAVGAFTVSARAEPRDLVEGETLRVTLEVRGSGSLGDFEPPRPEWPGFTCLGTLAGGPPEARTITYELRPESSAVREVPAIELPYFRPAPEPRYELARTGAIPILVRPRQAAAPEAPLAPPPAPSGGGSGLAWLVPVAVLAGAGAWIALRLSRTRQGS